MEAPAYSSNAILYDHVPEESGEYTAQRQRIGGVRRRQVCASMAVVTLTGCISASMHFGDSFRRGLGQAQVAGARESGNGVMQAWSPFYTTFGATQPTLSQAPGLLGAALPVAPTPQPSAPLPMTVLPEAPAPPIVQMAPLQVATSVSDVTHMPVEPLRPKKCWRIDGVKLAETEPRSLWKACAAKWAEDCSASACCQDPDMKCYNKGLGWSACKAECSYKDDLNETWTCTELAPEEPHTAEACAQRCAHEAGCAIAIFDSNSGGSCTLSSEFHHEVVWAADNFKSHICADETKETEMTQVVKKVHDQLPFTNPSMEVQLCSWAGEDCSTTLCCNDVSCDANFTNCESYTCYRKSPYFSGCRLGKPPKSWNGTVLGGGRTRRSINRAGSQVALQGTSLYCFSVVNWDAPAPQPYWSTERELADNIKNNGVGIMQCDAHDWYDGIPTPKAAWGSFSNIDAFRQIWDEVRNKGEYKKYDWVVKVDADAVFFPDRLKQHIDKLLVPRGAFVYLENIDYRFRFMGALEVLTKEALDLYFERSPGCIRGKHEGGEDFFMRGCMDAIGIDHMSDFSLLHDRYAAQDDPCTDGWVVAYHFHKKVISWNWCYNEAVCGTRDASCQKGLEVKYVMPWTPAPTTTTTLQ